MDFKPKSHSVVFFMSVLAAISLSVRVQVLLDMSGMSVHYQLHIQHALRLLLQEQLANKHSFNVTV